MCTDHAHFKVGVTKKVFNFLLILFAELVFWPLNSLKDKLTFKVGNFCLVL